MARSTRTRTETSAGGVVFRCTEAGPQFLLIHDGHKNWGFPKGHVDEGERPGNAARRETCEETGLDDLVLHEPLGVVDWFFRWRGELIHKYCHLFLFESRGGAPTPQSEEGITDCRWCSFGDALRMIPYENARGVLLRARDYVSDLCAERGHEEQS